MPRTKLDIPARFDFKTGIVFFNYKDKKPVAVPEAFRRRFSEGTGG